MNISIDLTITNIHARTWLTRLLARSSLFLILLLFACVGLAPTVQAVTPAPDGSYPNANTAEGAGALQSLTSGIHNTALGYQALFFDNAGSYNTATGSQALRNNTANDNTADGFQALVNNTTGNSNSATGWRALYLNTTGNSNTANGLEALYSNTSGFGNTADGVSALFHNKTGSENTAQGFQALVSNTTGSFNTAVGKDALFDNRGNNNIALGFQAGVFHNLGDNNIFIGNEGVEDSNHILIGQQGTQTITVIAGISGTAVTGAAVVVNGFGQLGVAPSSQRFKAEIKPMDIASEAILALRPVMFRYKKEIDPKHTPQFGLVAEDVEKVNPALITRDADGKPFTVRYEAVNAMLLNEFLKAHRKMEQQEATIAQLKSTVAKQETTAAQQQKQIEALTAGLQKVSAQIETGGPAAQIVENNPR